MSFGDVRNRSPHAFETAFTAAALTSAAVVSFDMAGRATRDALFLTAFGPSRLPTMVVLGSALALCVGVGAARLLVRTAAPARLLARVLLASALLLLAEWAIAPRFPGAVAVLFYLHFTSASGLFISGFWTVVSERFDPAAARRSIARIAAAGTVGGLLGGLVAGWVASTSVTATMLPVLAAINLAAALTVGRLASARAEAMHIEPVGLGIRGVGLPPYVQVLLAVVVIGAVNETVLDFLFMSRASAASTSSEALLRLFALFYTAAAVLTVLVQLLVTRQTMEVVGLPVTAASLPTGVLLGAAGGLAWPGLTSAAAARGVEMVLRNSTFRAAYELLFNAMPPRQKRVAKTVVDVTAQRLGRIVGSGVIQAALLLAPGRYAPALGGIVVALALLALMAFRWVARHHHHELERSLVRRASRAVEVVGRDLLDTTVFPVFTDAHAVETAASLDSTYTGAEEPRRAELAADDPRRVVAALADGPLPVPLVPAVVGLLAWDEVAAAAIEALRAVAAESDAILVDALANRRMPVKIRRRAVLALADCATPTARDGLVAALRDERFEVRYRASQALRRLARLAPDLAPARDRVLPIIESELDHGLSLVHGGRAVALLPEDEADRGLLGEVLRERRDQVLEHVFTLLGFCYPDEPLATALRAVRSGDVHLHATALDYLESTLPMDLRRRLWPVLEGTPVRRTSLSGPPQRALHELLASRHSIEVRVDELRDQVRALERPAEGTAKPAEPPPPDG
jgi:AAA family ATP:ADP antiporter